MLVANTCGDVDVGGVDIVGVDVELVALGAPVVVLAAVLFVVLVAMFWLGALLLATGGFVARGLLLGVILCVATLVFCVARGTWLVLAVLTAVEVAVANGEFMVSG